MNRRAYFAYGANIDINHMSCACPHSLFVGPAILDGHRFLINDDGWATVVADPEGEVHGVLWMLSEECENALDIQEDIEGSLYRKESISVRSDNRIVDAMIYIARSSIIGIPNPGYLERIITWSSNFGFPETYQQHLENHTSKKSS